MQWGANLWEDGRRGNAPRQRGHDDQNSTSRHRKDIGRAATARQTARTGKDTHRQTRNSQGHTRTDGDGQGHAGTNTEEASTRLLLSFCPSRPPASGPYAAPPAQLPGRPRRRPRPWTASSVPRGRQGAAVPPGLPAGSPRCRYLGGGGRTADAPLLATRPLSAADIERDAAMMLSAAGRRRRRGAKPPPPGQETRRRGRKETAERAGGEGDRDRGRNRAADRDRGGGGTTRQRQERRALLAWREGGADAQSSVEEPFMCLECSFSPATCLA